MKRRERKRLKLCRHRKAKATGVRRPSVDQGPRNCLDLGRVVRAGVVAMQDAALFFVYWLVDYYRHLRQRPPVYWYTLLTLGFTVMAGVGTWLAALKSTPSQAKVHFDTGVIEDGKGGGARSFATPDLHEVLRLRLTLTPSHQDLGQVAVVIAPPPSGKLTDRCFYKITSRKGRRSCLESNGEGRVEIDRLDAGETLEVIARAEVV